MARSLAPYLLAEGGRGGGKSTAVLWELIRDCLMVPKCNCLMLRRTFTGVEKGIEDHFSKYVPREVYKRHNTQKHVVTFRNGSKLFFGHIKSDRDLLQYQSAEFLTIGWEELTQFTFQQWNWLKGSNRCPIKFDKLGRPTLPRMIGSTNPNGKGAQWVKALWITHKPPAGEMVLGYDVKDYVNFHSTYADNPTYANDLNYIKGLQSISDPILRAAWIPGSWEILAGQFFSNWEAWFDEKKNRYVGRHIKTRRDVVFHDWEDRWIAIDWGFEHHCVALWFARVTIRDALSDIHRTGKKERSIIVCYRELVLRKLNEFAIAEKVVEKNWSSAEDFDRVKYIYLSPDRFGKDKPEHSIAENMGDVFVESKLPRPERANNSRVDGWRLTYTLLDTDELAILDTCTDTIESIPKLMRSEKDPEDAEKEGSDLFLDVCEAFRYGVMSYAAKAPIPEDVLIDERIKSIKDPTAKYMEYLRLTSQPSRSDVVLPIPPRGPGWKRGQ
jgi:phage terminase large subunit